MLMEKIVENMTKIELQELLNEKLMDLIASLIDTSLLSRADKDILHKLVNNYEFNGIYIKEKPLKPTKANRVVWNYISTILYQN